MDEQHLSECHDRIHAQGRERDRVGLYQIIGDRKLDRCKPIESDRDSLTFTSEHFGEFLLRLDQLCQALLGHTVAGCSASCYVGPDLFQAGSHDQLLS